MNNKEFPQQANMPYPYPMPYQDNDEIDLVELFRTLWKQKAKIALVTAATTLVAGIYAFTAEEVWTSKAVFDAPKLEEIGSYYEFTQQLRRTLQKPTIGAITLIPDQITKEVFTEFQKQTNSIDLRREFWSQSDYYHNLVINIKSEKDKEKKLDDLIEKNITVVPIDEQKVKFPSVSLSVNDATTAKELLIQYVDKLNAKVWKSKSTELKTILKEEVAELENEKKLLEFRAETDRNNSIDIIRKAKSVAEKANIKELNLSAMQGNANVSSRDMLFFLGTKALDAQIDNLVNKPVTMPVRYYEVERMLTELKKLPEFKVDIKSYRYLQAPSEPLTRDGPKRTLIIVVSFLFGMILSCIAILIKKVFLNLACCNK
ncbi:lipopolysaccharide biosynthesis protein [Tolumonas auensis DSM 9187]|uniref:Lipopolysaccharide biosynthesis protein n=1 Tax=Tolumonas auensis (strain DSM 9187 / NBRC 110442 / TA 4) TaxID=595494 RepID=C4L7N8_TOLAT|nr:Wzz/FepE/Etk N-terminal domain-containing protein [Tolumonas auensis]ACQ93654.1 lipopolysaccharide biosynthesis protein [Tolumonas auensis DSM 9187]